MAVSRDGRHVSGMPEAERVACTVLRRIKGRDLPGGMPLFAERLAPVLRAEVADVSAAMELLESQGALFRADGFWLVPDDQHVPPRDFLLRIHPMLTALARMAATNIRPGQAVALADAYWRFSSPASGLDNAGRSAAYADIIRLMAEATGSIFQQITVRQALEEARGTIERIVADVMRLAGEPDPDDELARLTRAIAESDVAGAVQAAEDHMLVIGVRMDRLF